MSTDLVEFSKRRFPRAALHRLGGPRDHEPEGHALGVAVGEHGPELAAPLLTVPHEIDKAHTPLAAFVAGDEVLVGGARIDLVVRTPAWGGCPPASRVFDNDRGLALLWVCHASGACPLAGDLHGTCESHLAPLLPLPALPIA